MDIYEPLTLQCQELHRQPVETRSATPTNLEHSRSVFVVYTSKSITVGDGSWQLSLPYSRATIPKQLHYGTHCRAPVRIDAEHAHEVYDTNSEHKSSQQCPVSLQAPRMRNTRPAGSRFRWMQLQWRAIIQSQPTLPSRRKHCPLETSFFFFFLPKCALQTSQPQKEDMKTFGSDLVELHMPIIPENISHSDYLRKWQIKLETQLPLPH